MVKKKKDLTTNKPTSENIVNCKSQHKTRKDVAERKLQNKDTQFTCVKMSLNTFVKDNDFYEKIQDVVLNINKISFLSYQLLNYHFIRLIQNKIELPELTQNLFYQACYIVSVLNNRKAKEISNPELSLTFSLYKKHLDILPYRDKMGNLISNLNKQQLTMTLNHLKLNFYKRFSKYLQLITGETRKNIIYNWLKDIYVEEYKGNNYFIHYMRKFCKYVPTEKNIKENPTHFIKIYYKILQTFEKYPNQKGVRTFNLLPTKNTFSLFSIEICSSCLKDLISHFDKKSVPKDFNDNKSEVWNELFNIKKCETKNRKFANTIYTDGKSVSIRLSKHHNNNVKHEIKYEQYIGLDPGVRCVQTSCNDDDRVLQTTTKSYRHNCKMKYATKKREMWYSKWELNDMWKNIPTFKTTNLNIMDSYFKHVYPYLDHIFNFHMEKNFRGVSFKKYCFMKKTLHNICSDIVDNKKTLIGFGDFSQHHGLVKKHPTAPIQKLKHELKRYCDIVEIDEWGTSKTCNRCLRPVVLYKNRIIKENGEVKLSLINSVIRCSSNECSLCCLDRDINAAKNMLMLLHLQVDEKERPICFGKKETISYNTPKEGKLSKEGKYVKTRASSLS